jgi:S1-C subfamily serine protease
MLASAACGGDDDNVGEELPSGTPAGEGGVESLAHSVVQIMALDDAGEPVWTGSGTMISSDGMILTNGHVVDDRNEDYAMLGIAVTEATDEAPTVSYYADILAVDYSLDLAVIGLRETVDGDPVTDEFSAVELGDSDGVEIGEEVRILGYPGIGGETITFTRGAVSGFTSERSVGDRAWIKTDATIAGGNSGGLAVNASGEIIGVPTLAGAGAETDATDCRVIQDTNGDNVLDDSDTCVPVGGFINGLRPINLARDLIDAATSGEEYVSPYYDQAEFEDAPDSFDVSAVELLSLVFSPDVTADDQPTEVVSMFPSGSVQICGFWEYSGMEDGMTWDAIWYADGEQQDESSFIGEAWVGGESGSWWVCIVDEENALADGLYELIISVEAEPVGSEAVFVGDDRELVNLTIENTADVEVCGVWASPVGAQNWGFEDLGPETTIPPGQSATIEVATGLYDISADDCEGNVVQEESEIEISGNSVYTVTG